MGRGIQEITLESTVMDLGIDSLDSVEIIMEFEDKFNISIPDELIPETPTNFGGIVKEPDNLGSDSVKTLIDTCENLINQ